VNERLREINRSLRALDEAHRLGHISREEYRTRRRQLLRPLCDSGGITARNTVADRTMPRSALRTEPGARRSRDAAVSTLFPRRSWSWLFFWRRGPQRRR
jgi:hypothetical protein